MANTLNVQGTEITIIKVHAEDYICLTDMLKAKDGDIENKLNNTPKNLPMA